MYVVKIRLSEFTFDDIPPMMAQTSNFVLNFAICLGHDVAVDREK